MKLLVVVDMQKDFVDGSLGTCEAQSIVDNVVRKIENWEGSIVCTLDTHGENYLDTQEGKFLPVSHCIKDTAGWQFNEKVAAALEKKNHCVIEKPTFGSEKLVEYVALREAIGSLPEKERMVILLRYYRGMTQSDTARVIGVSQVQVSRLERRAVDKLKVLLE